MGIQGINAITPTKNINIDATEIKAKVEQSEKEIKDKNKKIALTLTGLATAGIAAVGIALALKKGKGIEEVVENIEAPKKNDLAQLSDDIKETVEIKDGGFVFSKEPKVTKGDYATSALLDDIINDKGTRKYLAGFEYSKNELGQQIVEYEVVVENPKFKNGEFQYIKKGVNLETGEEWIIPEEKALSVPVIRKTSSDGITIKNGEEFAKRTVETSADGDKLIKVDYPNSKKEILIKKDGTRTERKDGRFLDM